MRLIDDGQNEKGGICGNRLEIFGGRRDHVLSIAQWARKQRRISITIIIITNIQ
jgi:hypothetical protein